MADSCRFSSISDGKLSQLLRKLIIYTTVSKSGMPYYVRHTSHMKNIFKLRHLFRTTPTYTRSMAPEFWKFRLRLVLSMAFCPSASAHGHRITLMASLKARRDFYATLQTTRENGRRKVKLYCSVHLPVATNLTLVLSQVTKREIQKS